MKTVLCVEDSIRSQEIIKRILEGKYNTVIVDSAEQASNYLEKNTPDLLLLDINLPVEDGISFYSRNSGLIQDKTIPTIFLTGKEDISSKISAFELGATDYIVKPFNPTELLLRIEARISSGGANTEVMVSEGIYIDRALSAVYKEFNGEREAIEVSPIEFKIFNFFVSNPEQIFSRDQIFDNVWGKNTHFSDRTIDRHISSLKKKIPWAKEALCSVYGSGYQFKSGDMKRPCGPL